MGEARFRIVPAGEEWRLEHGAGEQTQHVACMTRAAAIEAAVLAAQRAMREACAVHIIVDPSPNPIAGRRQN